MNTRKLSLLALISLLLVSLTLSGCLVSSGGVTKEFKLVINVEGQGSVVPKAGKHEYTKVTTVSLEAKPAEKWEFSHWIGEVEKPNLAKTEMLVDGDKSVTAVFAASLGEPVSVSSGDSITFQRGIALDLSNITIPGDTKVTVSDVADETNLPSELSPACAIVSIAFDATDLDFENGVTLRLPIEGQADVDTTGVFYKQGDHWEYQPTTIEDGFATTTVTHFSTYAVLDAKPTQAPESSVSGMRVDKGQGIVLSTSTPGAEIRYSTTSPDLPGDYQTYESPLSMRDPYFEFYAYAQAPNMIPSDVKTFWYVDSESIIITVTDDSGKFMSDVTLKFTDGSAFVQTDDHGIAIQLLETSETIVAPYLDGHIFEPSALIAEKGTDLSFTAFPSVKSYSKTELTFNPVQFDDSHRFNPFAFPKIREAMNRLIDRDRLVQELNGIITVHPALTFINLDTFDHEFMAEVILNPQEDPQFYNWRDELWYAKPCLA